MSCERYLGLNIRRRFIGNCGLPEVISLDFTNLTGFLSFKHSDRRFENVDCLYRQWKWRGYCTQN